MFKVSCPHCGVRLTASDELLGKPVNCQNCRVKFILSNRWMNEPLNMDNESSISDSPAVGLVSSSEGNSSGLFAETEKRSFKIEIDDLPSDSEKSLIPPSPQNQVPNPNSQRASQETEFPVSVSPTISGTSRTSTVLNNCHESGSFLVLFDFRFRYFLTPLILRLTWILAIFLAAIWLLLLSYFCVSALLNQSPTLFPTTSFSISGQTAETDTVPLGRVPLGSSISPMLINLAWFATLTLVSLLVLLWVRILLETMMMVFCIGDSLKKKFP